MHTLRNLYYFFCISSIVMPSLQSQTAFCNTGNVRIHTQGQIGFHIDVINDGEVSNNLGTAGFYSSESLSVSGNNALELHDVTVAVVEDLTLSVAVGVTNFQEFVAGRVVTPRMNKEVALAYVADAPYLGANDDRYVDGYASATGMLDVTFPVGDDYRLRPVGVANLDVHAACSAAYFFENPNQPNYFSTRFDTQQFDASLFGVSIFEFWDVNGGQATQLTLTWDANSNIPSLVSDLEDLRVVGWHKDSQRWVNLGNVSVSGSMDQGMLTSATLIPDAYEAFTFGTSSKVLDSDLEIFTAVSPNGDGLNDTFRIDGLAKFPDNELLIYNRWGVLVYQQKAYHEHQNFAGTSEGRATISAKDKLPTGTYYYVLLLDGEKDRAGYLYING